jgi:hypothetical protein
MGRVLLGQLGNRPVTDDVGTAAARYRGGLWCLAAAGVGWLSSWVSVSVFGLAREVFVLPYLVGAAALTLLFVRKEKIDLGAEIQRRPMRSFVVTALAAGLVVATVLAQPGAPRAHGGRLLFELAWDGVVYGAVDGILLTALPMVAIEHMLGEGRWMSDALAWLASIAVFVVYHLGFPEFHGPTMLAPVAAALVFGAAYLGSRNPLVPVVVHAAMHVAAVLHGPAGTLQLPPHY